MGSGSCSGAEGLFTVPRASGFGDAGAEPLDLSEAPPGLERCAGEPPVFRAAEGSAPLLGD